MTRIAILSLVSVLALGGCAHLPTATVGYYLPTSSVSFKVVRTVACDAGGNPIIATSVTPTVVHFADKATGQQLVSFAKLKGQLSDSDVKFDFYEDGRLSAVNATATGQGEPILKSAFTVASTLLKAGGVGLFLLTPTQCQQIKDFGGGKPLTVTYSAKVATADNATTKIEPDADSEFYVNELKSIFRPLKATATGHMTPAPPFDFKKTPNDVVVVGRQPGAVHFKIEVEGAAKALWDDDVTVATVGTNYELPIPRPGPFGTKKLAVSFAESGAVKSVQYVANTGAGQALNVAGSALTTLQGDSTATKAAAVKAEADLIVQQERLVACKADPAACK